MIDRQKVRFWTPDTFMLFNRPPLTQCQVTSCTFQRWMSIFLRDTSRSVLFSSAAFRAYQHSERFFYGLGVKSTLNTFRPRYAITRAARGLINITVSAFRNLQQLIKEHFSNLLIRLAVRSTSLWESWLHLLDVASPLRFSCSYFYRFIW